jgi:hypothetical protein
MTTRISREEARIRLSELVIAGCEVEMHGRSKEELCVQRQTSQERCDVQTIFVKHFPASADEIEERPFSGGGLDAPRVLDSLVGWEEVEKWLET